MNARGFLNLIRIRECLKGGLGWNDYEVEEWLDGKMGEEYYWYLDGMAELTRFQAIDLGHVEVVLEAAQRRVEERTY